MNDTRMSRNRIFRRFDEADYYYRSEGIRLIKDRIQEAVNRKDELSEIKAYEELYNLLSFDQDVTWKLTFFENCLRPMRDVYTSSQVVGPINDFLGGVAFELNLAVYREYYDRAIEGGCEEVLKREEVLKAYPEIIFKDLECKLHKGDMMGVVELCAKLDWNCVRSWMDARP